MPESATVEAVGGRLVVWSVEKVNEFDEPYSRFIACRRSSGARVRVITTLDDCCVVDELPHVRVAGRFVAYVRDQRYRGEQRLNVFVFDAFARRDTGFTYAAYDSPYGPPTPSSVEALVLSRTGAFAFVVRHPDEQSDEGYLRVPVGLRAFDSGGRRLLDKGEGIDPASLRLEGGLVHWMNAGEPRSAPLR